MNYINNPNNMCCCSFDHGDFIHVERCAAIAERLRKELGNG